MNPTTAAALYGNDQITADPTDNDLDPTPSQYGDFEDWWTGNEPWRDFSAEELHADPLLAVLLDSPGQIIRCSTAAQGDQA